MKRKRIITGLLLIIWVSQATLGLIAIMAMQILLKSEVLYIEFEVIVEFLIKFVKWMIIRIVPFLITILAVIIPTDKKDSD